MDNLLAWFLHSELVRIGCMFFIMKSYDKLVIFFNQQVKLATAEDTLLPFGRHMFGAIISIFLGILTFFLNYFQ